MNKTEEVSPGQGVVIRDRAGQATRRDRGRDDQPVGGEEASADDREVGLEAEAHAFGRISQGVEKAKENLATGNPAPLEIGEIEVQYLTDNGMTSTRPQGLKEIGLDAHVAGTDITLEEGTIGSPRKITAGDDGNMIRLEAGEFPGQEGEIETVVRTHL